jgi:hypothetical protein
MDEKFNENKKRAIEERKKEFDNRLSKLEDLAEDQKAALIAQYKKEV